MGPSVANAWRGPRGRPRRGLTTRRFRGSITQRLISLSTLRSDGHPSPRKTRFPAAGPALPDGIGYPQGFNERFHIVEMILLSRASWRKFVRRVLPNYGGFVRYVSVSR